MDDVARRRRLARRPSAGAIAARRANGIRVAIPSDWIEWKLCGRVVLARLAVAREVHVVPRRGDRSRPAEEVDRAHVPDPEHAKRTVGHGGPL